MSVLITRVVYGGVEGRDEAPLEEGDGNLVLNLEAGVMRRLVGGGGGGDGNRLQEDPEPSPAVDELGAGE